MSRDEMVSYLKAQGYKNCKVKGGEAPLDTAPIGNIYYFYRSVSGRKAKEHRKLHEVQMEMEFMK